MTRSPRPRPLIAAALTFVAAGLLVTGCEIATPEMPRFTTRLSIPIGEEQILIADLVDDEDYLIAMDDGSLGFFVSGDPDTLALDFDLGVDVPAQQVAGELGAFRLDLDAGTSFAFTLVQLYPPAGALDGQTSPVPPFVFASQSGAEDIPDIESASLAAGTLTVTVGNGLPVAVSATSGPDRLVLDLLDPQSGAVLVTVEFDPIGPGDHAVQQASLAGVDLPDHLAVRLAGGSAGSSGQPVPVDAAAAITVDATFADLEVTAAVAVVPAQQFTTSTSTALPADYEVIQAILDGGALTISLDNEMAIPCQTTVVWPTVVDLDGVPTSLVIDLAGGASATRVVDFAGRIVRAPDGEVLTDLETSVLVTSPGSGGQAVPLRSDQGVRAAIGAGRLEFLSVTGMVPSLSRALSPSEQAIELPDELDGLSLCRASLVLELTTTAGVPATATFDLEGINQAGERRTMTVEEQIAAAEGGRAATTRILLDETNSTIVDFLNHLPTSIVLAGNVDVGGDQQIGTVRRGDLAIINWQITSPVEVVVHSSQLFGDPEALDLDDDMRDLIDDHAGEASVTLDILSHLPVGVTARVLFGPDPEAIKSSPTLVVGPVAVDPGTTAPAGGVVLEPRRSLPVLTLSAADARLLATRGLHHLLEVTLPSTDGMPVRVMVNDYITVRGLVRLDLDVHDNR